MMMMTEGLKFSLFLREKNLFDKLKIKLINLGFQN